MKNQEQVQWSVLPENVEVLCSALEIHSTLLGKTTTTTGRELQCLEIRLVAAVFLEC